MSNRVKKTGHYNTVRLVLYVGKQRVLKKHITGKSSPRKTKEGSLVLVSMCIFHLGTGRKTVQAEESAQGKAQRQDKEKHTSGQMFRCFFGMKSIRYFVVISEIPSAGHPEDNHWTSTIWKS